MRKLRMGMIGGGQGSFIGEVHRIAARLDGHIDLVCGAFSSTPERSLESGRALHIQENRCYANFEEMIEKEKNLPSTERMDFVAIVTPNHMHFSPAKLALQNGFHVVCDKPLTLTLEEAFSLERIVNSSGLLFVLTHNYPSSPMIQQARAMVLEGEFGQIRKVVVQYLQGWLSTALENTGQKQAAWRVDPSKSGIGGALGDIGTHAHNLVEFTTGLKIVELAADLGKFGKNRVLDDDGNVLIRLENGAKGSLSFSQIALGEENNLAISVYGDKGSFTWRQENPNELVTRWLDKPKTIYTPNGVSTSSIASSFSRIPAGHPEGYLEAFANIYKNFAIHLNEYLDGKMNGPANYPGIKEGVRGMQFIYACVNSSENNSDWKKI
ncbi:Gfo/Idh/MocA family protein [Namhaeicola litoreus]|uniref:Gfo/Idh/MocA family protein n=1 Tax=Namhaeicola litoreus TaxID=1052145 RepID=A0ABW3Y617_9FLAO